MPIVILSFLISISFSGSTAVKSMTILPAEKQNPPAREKRRARLFEDEKFAYAVLAACPTPPRQGVIRRPDLRPGHVMLDLCTDGRPRASHGPKRDGLEYRKARKVAWGDTL